MRGLIAGMAIAVLVFGMGGLAQDLGLSGSWGSELSLAEGSVNFTNSLALNLALSGWTLSSTWTLGNGALTGSTIELASQLGNVDFALGASFTLPKGISLQEGSGFLYLDDLQLSSWHLSLRLSLGNLSLGLTLVGSGK